MKKNLFMVAAVALMAMVSCNKEEIGNNGVEGGHASDIVFSAELEQPGAPAAEQTPAAVQTKTSLGTTTGGVTSVNWTVGDKVKINGVEFSATAAGSRTDFTTTLSFTEAETYYAVYPASAAGASDLTKVTIPASQNGTFAEAAISVAQSNTQSLHFKNVASILKFHVPAACSEVTIESTSDLAGTFPVTFDDKGLPVIGTVTNGSKKITVTGSFETGTDYYVAVLSGDKSDFKVSVDSKLAKNTTKVSLSRSAMLNIGRLEGCSIHLVGTMQNPQWKPETVSFPMRVEGSYYVYNNITGLNNDTQFKFVDGTTWDNATGGSGENAAEGYWYNTGGSNVTTWALSSTNKYNIYLKKDKSTFMIKSPISYTSVGIIGQHTNWETETPMTLVGSWFVAKNVNITGGFKFRRNKSWDEGYAYGSTATYDDKENTDTNKYISLINADNGSAKNIVVSNGTYDIYLSKHFLEFVVVPAGTKYLP